MATVKYPIDIDTDAEIPRIEDNISEIGGEVINQLRAAVFAIEKALGRKPQGTAADLAARLGVSLDNNGNIKAAALSGIGLVTLPITNAQVGSAAGVEESKLDLDYGTALLKSWIDSLKVRVDALEAAVALDIAHLGQHIVGTWGRHTTGHIDAYGVFAGRTAQGALTNLDTRLNAHITDIIDAHDGSAISLDVDQFSIITATDVQTAAEQLEELQLVEVIKHRDRQHGNGILGTQDVFVAGTKRSFVVLGPNAISLPVKGSASIVFTGTYSASAFLSIAKNDRVDLVLDGVLYSFIASGIQVTGTGGLSTNTVELFGSIPVTASSTALATIYQNEEETSEPSVAIAAMRNDDTVSRPVVIQLVHPSAPYVMSSGFQGSALAVPSSFRVYYFNGIYNEYTANLDIGTAMSSYLPGVSSAWTVENVARTINAALFAPNSTDPHYPLVAFSHGGELGIALDNPDPDGYVMIVDPSSGSNALPSLGFNSGQSSVNLAPRSLYIDGYEFFGFRKTLDAYGYVLNASDIALPGIDLAALGIGAGALVHLTRTSGVVPPPTTDNGTYIASSIPASNQLRFDITSEHDFTSIQNKGMNVKVYADYFSLPSIPSLRTLYELFLEGYGSEAALMASPRALYKNFSGQALEDKLDVVAVSRSLRSSLKRLYYDASARTLQLGARLGSPNGGLLASVPVSDATNKGFLVRVYAENGADYIDFEVTDALPPSGTGQMDITVRDRISEKRFIQVATILHDRVNGFKRLDDTRQFGTVGRQDVRDDFTRDFVTYPRSLLRGNGVLRGLSVSAGSLPSAGPLVVEGGEIFVNGEVKSIGKTSLEVSADTLGGLTKYNLFVDRHGVLRLLQDDTTSGFITPSLAELLSSITETVLAQLDVNAANIIVAIRDLRRFVNDIDSKLDLLVEENGITHGSFASLAAAVAYISALPNLPISRRIRIRGNVNLDSTVLLPENVSLEGDVKRGTAAGDQVPTITFTSGSVYVELSWGSCVRNLNFYRSGTLVNGFLKGSSSIKHITIENCKFEFASSTANNNAIVAYSFENSIVSGCWFLNTDAAIKFDAGAITSRFLSNRFDQFKTNGIILPIAADCRISGNWMYTDSVNMTPGSAFIKMGSVAGSGIIISDNIMSYTGSEASVANVAMVDVAGSGSTHSPLLISHNIMENASTGTGFAIGLLCLPVSSTVIDLIVSGNVFRKLSTASIGRGLEIDNCLKAKIEGNTFRDCRNSMRLSNSDDMVIIGNIVIGELGVGLDVNTSVRAIVLGNDFSTNSVTDNLCDFGTNSDYSIIMGNVMRTTVDTAGALLYVNGGYSLVSGNKLLSVLGFTTVSPMRIAGQSIVSMNAFTISGAVPPAGLIEELGPGMVDVLNKGQTYRIVIPIGNGIWYQDGASTNGWYPDGPPGHIVTTAGPHGFIDITSSLVPLGAKLVSLKFMAEATTPAEMAIEVYQTTYDGGTGSSIIGPINPPATLGLVTMTFPSNKYMSSTSVFTIYISTSGTGNKELHPILVTYQL